MAADLPLRLNLSVGIITLAQNCGGGGIVVPLDLIDDPDDD